MSEEVKKIDELLKDDQEAISQVQKKSSKHKLVDEDLNDDKNDEQSLAADSLKELTKLSDEMDKTVKKNRLNKDKPIEKKKGSTLTKEEPAKKDQLPKDLKPLLAPPDHQVPKHVDEAITEKAHQLQPLIDAQKKLGTGLQQQNKTSEHPSVHEDLSKMHQKNETSTTQVKTNNLNLGDNATKTLNQSNSTSHNSTTLPSQIEVK